MTFRRIASLALAVLMLCATLCACGNTQPTSTPEKPDNKPTNKPTEPAKETALYQVTVVGVDGKPATSGVFVKFMQNGEQVAIQNTNVAGVAEKELEKGDYTVELMFSGSNKYYFDDSDMTLSKTKTQLTINLCLEQRTDFEIVYVNDVEHTAYFLSAGNTYVTLKPGRNYFLFQPEISGEYQFYTAGGTHKVGYYGGTFYIQANDVGKEAPNNGTALSLSNSHISPNSSFVIGVDNPGEEDVNVILQAVRVGEYIDTSIPKEIYSVKHPLTVWTLPSKVTVKLFNIRSNTTYNLVLDEATGFYHLNDVNGPLVVVFLGKNAASYNQYLAPYDTILQNSSVTAYFKNEDGTYNKCEDYTNALQQYIGMWDENKPNDNNGIGAYEGGCIDRESGMYPLTEDLMYIIKNHGAYSGWWDSSDARYIFQDITVNPENAWLFMCGYLEEVEEEN